MITGSIVALVTPMHPDGAIDWAAMATLIEYHIESGTAAICVVGTTGESPTLTVPEHCELIRFAVEQSGGRIPVFSANRAWKKGETPNFHFHVSRCLQ